MWFTGYCCGVKGARTAAVGRNHSHDHNKDDGEDYHQTVMGCTPSILSNGSNNQQQQQSRKDSGLYVGNVTSSGNGSNDTSNAAAAAAGNNNKLSNSSPVNPTMVNAPYPGAASKDGGTEKVSKQGFGSFLPSLRKKSDKSQPAAA